MTRDVKTCSPNEDLARAAQIMWENDCGCVPIVDEGRLVGMLTDRDICMAGYMQGKTYAQIPVGAAMSRHVFTIHEHDDVKAAEALMQKHQIRRLPVVGERGTLRGLLSINDIALHVRRTPDIRRDGLSSEAVARTLAAICEPYPL